MATAIALGCGAGMGTVTDAPFAKINTIPAASIIGHVKDLFTFSGKPKSCLTRYPAALTIIPATTAIAVLIALC